MERLVESCCALDRRAEAASGFPFDTVAAAVAAIARGEFVVVVDDESRENEGDLIIAADAVTPEAIGFMLRHTSDFVRPGQQLIAYRRTSPATAMTERNTA